MKRELKVGGTAFYLRNFSGLLAQKIGPWGDFGLLIEQVGRMHARVMQAPRGRWIGRVIGKKAEMDS